MKRFIIAIDQGTTSSRAVIFDKDRNLVAMAAKEIKQLYPKEGFIEHDPLELYESVRTVVVDVIAKADINPAEIACIGITNQRETTIVFDKRTGKPIYNAIVWQCRRTADICRRLVDMGLEKYIRENTGLLIDPYFSATKIAWILENINGAKEEAENGNLLFSTVDSWLLYKLTEGEIHATDHTNASRTMLFNIKELKWDKTICQALNIPMKMLPEARESGGLFGHTDIQGVKIPITCLVGDQQGALFGQGCLKAGDAKNTYGTGCFLLVNTGSELVLSKKGLLSTIGISFEGEIMYALEGSVFIAGALMKWLRDELALFISNDEIEEMARRVKDTLGVYIVPAFSGLGAPYWDMSARGAIFGLTRGAGKEHLVRAGLEAIAYQVYDLLQAVGEDISFDFNSFKVDGGASVNNLLMEIQSSFLELDIIRPALVESTAYGAFLIAGLSLGFWESKEAVFLSDGKEEVFHFRMDSTLREKMLEGWRKSVAADRFWSAR